MPPNLRLAPLPSKFIDTSDPQPIRVVLAEDHSAMRRNLRRLLDAAEGVTMVAEATDLAMAARHVHGHLPDVLILDLHLPSGSAVGMVRDLGRRVPETKVVVLTMEGSPAFAQHALDAGAVGYVLKEHADRDLLPAVRAAVYGESYVTREVAALLASTRTAGVASGRRWSATR